MLFVEDLRVTVVSEATEPKKTLMGRLKNLSEGMKELMKISFQGQRDGAVRKAPLSLHMDDQGLILVSHVVP